VVARHRHLPRRHERIDGGAICLHAHIPALVSHLEGEIAVSGGQLGVVQNYALDAHVGEVHRRVDRRNRRQRARGAV